MITTLPKLAEVALLISITAPLLVLVVLGVSLLSARRPTERRVHQLVAASMSAALTLTSALLLGQLLGVLEPVVATFGTLVAVPGYHLDVLLRADLLGTLYLWLGLLLCGLVGAFSAPYMHREPGYHRFYMLLMAFLLGVSLVATAAGLEVLLVGWELIGLSSALLIAFFFQRAAPVEHGLRAFAVYRLADIGLFLALVLIHHHAGSAAFKALAGLRGEEVVWIGGLLIFAAMGKGALVPFTPWLPRAMEGPTPSSAIFYGALSIHASPFLLLRVEPLLRQHAGLTGALVAIGAITAAHATMVGRAQSDIKSSLAYASVAQVGLMWIWIGQGWTTLAIVHLVGHACWRTWRLLRAPSQLQARHQLEARLGQPLHAPGAHLERWMPERARRAAYRVALERWYLNELWTIAHQVSVRALDAVDSLDRWWAATLERPTPPPEAAEAADSVETRSTP